MASLNKVMLIGRLGKDPEIISFDNGTKKMTTSLATSERYFDRSSNQWQEQTDWHNLVAWGNIALDIAEKRRNYIKGDLMYVEGKIRSREYVDGQKQKRYITEIIVERMNLISSSRNYQSGTDQNATSQGNPTNYNPIEATKDVQQLNNDTQITDMPDSANLPF